MVPCLGAGGGGPFWGTWRGEGPCRSVSLLAGWGGVVLIAVDARVTVAEASR